LLHHNPHNMNVGAVVCDTSGQFRVRVVGSDISTELPRAHDIIMSSGWFIDGGYYWKITSANVYPLKFVTLYVERMNIETFEYTITNTPTVVDLWPNFNEQVIPTIPCDNGRIGAVYTGWGEYYVVRFADGHVTMDTTPMKHANIKQHGNYIAWDPYRHKFHVIHYYNGRLYDDSTSLSMSFGDVSYNVSMFMRDGILTIYEKHCVRKISVDTNTLISKVNVDSCYLRRIMITEHMSACIDSQTSDIHLEDMRTGDMYDIAVAREREVVYNRLI